MHFPLEFGQAVRGAFARFAGIFRVKQSIYSHVYENGLVLLAEAMESVESAAFSFRVPAGCVYDPAKLGGLSTMTCELAMRGCGERDNRQFVNDLDNLGVERGESVSDAQPASAAPR